MNDAVSLACASYNHALDQIGAGNITVGAQELQHSLHVWPDDADALNLLGLCSYYQGDFAAAKGYWRQSVRLRPDSNAAQGYLDSLETPEFAAWLAQYNAGLAALQEGRIGAGIEAFRQIIADGPPVVEPHILLGLAYWQAGQTAEAMGHWRQAQVMDSGNSAVNRYLAIGVQQSGEKSVQAALRRGGRMAAAAAVAALVLVGSVGYFARGRVVATQAAAQAEIAAGQAGMQALQQQTDELQELVERLDADGLWRETADLPSGAPVFATPVAEQDAFNEALRLYRAKDYTAAAERFEQLVAAGLRRDLAGEALFFLARCRVAAGDNQAGVQCYLSYAQRFPQENYYDDALYEAGLLLYRLGEREVAVRVLTQLAEEAPGSVFVNSVVRGILEQG